MSAEPTIKCPDCGKDIKLTDAMAAPLLASAKKDFETKLRSATEQAAANASREANERVAEMTEKLGQAQKDQAEALRLQRELGDKLREVDVTIEKRVQQASAGIEAAARKKAEEDSSLKLREAGERETKYKEQLAEMQRRLEQGSQQAQGEVLETEIESRLRATFPQDSVNPVPKGEFGGDLLQTVMGQTPDPCGLIIWELKRTKNWTDSWLPKLRADQRTAKADVAVIITYALPKGIEVFDLVDGVWVCSPAAFVPLCMAIRAALIDVKSAKRSMDGMRTKAEQVYEYLTGPRFKQRVGAIIEFLSSQEKDLAAEIKAIQRIWGKRRESLERVMASTAGLYGDLQGIAGASLEELPGLSLEALAAPEVAA